MLRGLDASSVQGALPYKQLVEQDLRFVILKAQQGNDGFDPWFERNMKAGFDAGLEVFAYCFYYPLPVVKGKESRAPRSQAERFVERVYRYPEMKGRPIFVDMEWPEVVSLKEGKKGWKEWGCDPQQLSDHMQEGMAAVHELSGVLPGIYTYLWWWECIRKGAPAYGFPKGADVSWAALYRLWMAWYKRGWPKPTDRATVAPPWTEAEFWQFDGNGGLLLPNGVDSDFCVFHGDEEDLRQVAGRLTGPVHSSGGPVIEDAVTRP